MFVSLAASFTIAFSSWDTSLRTLVDTFPSEYRIDETNRDDNDTDTDTDLDRKPTAKPTNGGPSKKSKKKKRHHGPQAKNSINVPPRLSDEDFALLRKATIAEINKWCTANPHANEEEQKGRREQANYFIKLVENATHGDLIKIMVALCPVSKKRGHASMSCGGTGDLNLKCPSIDCFVAYLEGLPNTDKIPKEVKGHWDAVVVNARMVCPIDGKKECRGCPCWTIEEGLDVAALLNIFANFVQKIGGFVAVASIAGTSTKPERLFRQLNTRLYALIITEGPHISNLKTKRQGYGKAFAGQYTRVSEMMKAHSDQWGLLFESLEITAPTTLFDSLRTNDNIFFVGTANEIEWKQELWRAYLVLRGRDNYLAGIGLGGLTTEQRTTNGRKGYEASLAGLTPEQRTANGREGYNAYFAGLTTEERAANGKVGYDAYFAHLTPEQRSANARKAHAKFTPKQRSERCISMWQETHCFLLENPILAECNNNDCVRPKEKNPYLYRCYESSVGLIYISRRCQHESCTGYLVPIDQEYNSEQLQKIREKIERGTITPLGEDPPPIRGKYGDERILEAVQKIEERQGPDHTNVARATAAVFFVGHDCPSCKDDKKGTKSPTGQCLDADQVTFRKRKVNVGWALASRRNSAK